MEIDNQKFMIGFIKHDLEQKKTVQISFLTIMANFKPIVETGANLLPGLNKTIMTSFDVFKSHFSPIEYIVFIDEMNDQVVIGKR